MHVNNLNKQLEMSKAKDRAIEKYPVEMYEEVGWRCVDKNAAKRDYFVEGYRQAEKDLELGWEDIKKLGELMSTKRINDGLFDKEDYEEVLKRFKDLKHVK